MFDEESVMKNDTVTGDLNNSAWTRASLGTSRGPVRRKSSGISSRVAVLTRSNSARRPLKPWCAVTSGVESPA